MVTCRSPPQTPRYILGAIRNAKLVKEVFPGWKLKMYLEASESYDNVSSTVIDILKEENVELRFVHPDLKLAPMMWR